MSGKVNNQLIIYKGSLESFIKEMKHKRHLHEIPGEEVKAWVTAFTMRPSQNFCDGYVVACGYSENGQPLKVRLKVFESYYSHNMSENIKRLKDAENQIKGELMEDGFTVFEGQFDETGKTEGVWAS